MRLLLATAALTLAVGSTTSANRGPWSLTLLPGMGTISWSCDAHERGYRVYGLVYDPAGAAADQEVELLVGGRVVFHRRVLHELVRFPRLGAAVQTLRLAQAIEPGILRATVTVDFRPRPVSPSHCWPYLPPGLTVNLSPR